MASKRNFTSLNSAARFYGKHRSSHPERAPDESSARFLTKTMLGVIKRSVDFDEVVAVPVHRRLLTSAAHCSSTNSLTKPTMPKE